jgi:hypothetical protein
MVSTKVRSFVLGAVLCVLLPGCINADLINALANDPAVVTVSGFYLSLGLTPSPATGGYPTPNLSLGYGTITRVGKHDQVAVTVGASGEIKGVGQDQAIAPSLGGMSSLHVEAKNLKPEMKQEKKPSPSPPLSPPTSP